MLNKTPGLGISLLRGIFSGISFISDSAVQGFEPLSSLIALRKIEPLITLNPLRALKKDGRVWHEAYRGYFQRNHFSQRFSGSGFDGTKFGVIEIEPIGP